MKRLTLPHIVILGVAILLLGYFFAEMHDVNIINQDIVEQITTVSNMKQLGEVILNYQHEHSGKLPTSWTALAPYLQGNPYTKDKDILKCPYSSEDPCYRCTFRENVKDNDPLCWMSTPHKRHGFFFGYPEDEYRFVLYGDGHVKRLDEKEFEQMTLPPKKFTF